MKQVHVAVAVIESDRSILIALRKPEQHQGGLWEFPGGKVENDETVFSALQREIKEEIDLFISDAEPWMQVSHDYEDKSVLLDIWRITEFSGTPQGKEGQNIKWCPIDDLHLHAFPAANVSIVEAIQNHKLEQVSS
jgi:8-oxo-dGTP diphosphatase